MVARNNTLRVLERTVVDNLDNAVPSLGDTNAELAENDQYRPDLTLT
jgi:hypothetical protein